MPYVPCACKFDETEDNVIQWCDTHRLARDVAVKAEREACAKTAESSKQDHADCGHEPLYWDGRQDAAVCIRARSKYRV